NRQAPPWAQILKIADLVAEETLQHDAHRLRVVNGRAFEPAREQTRHRRLPDPERAIEQDDHARSRYLFNAASRARTSFGRDYALTIPIRYANAAASAFECTSSFSNRCWM